VPAARWLLGASLLVAVGCSGITAGKARGTTAPTSTAPPTGTLTALRTMAGVTPVLAASAVPPGWTASAEVLDGWYDLTYRSPSGGTLDLAVSVPNPPLVSAAGSYRIFDFRGDPKADYEELDRGDPGSRKFLIWLEPGRWAGTPGVANSARTTTVPYAITSNGVDTADFWVIVDSLHPVPAVGAGPSATAIPDEGLHDAQRVQVVMSGFAPYQRVRLSECPSMDVAARSPSGCGAQPALQPFVDLDSAGSGRASFVVHPAAAASFGGAASPCTTGCVLVATTGTAAASGPLAFGPPVPPPMTAVSLDQVDWASVTFPMTQCGKANGAPNPGVPVEPVKLAEPETSVVLAVVVVSCKYAADPPTAVLVYDWAASPTQPHLAQTLVTEHDYWVATAPPLASGTALTLAVQGYGPNDAGASPSVHAVLVWRWSNGVVPRDGPRPSPRAVRAAVARTRPAGGRAPRPTPRSATRGAETTGGRAAAGMSRWEPDVERRCRAVAQAQRCPGP